MSKNIKKYLCKLMGHKRTPPFGSYSQWCERCESKE